MVENAFPILDKKNRRLFRIYKFGGGCERSLSSRGSTYMQFSGICFWTAKQIPLFFKDAQHLKCKQIATPGPSLKIPSQ